MRANLPNEFCINIAETRFVTPFDKKIFQWGYCEKKIYRFPVVSCERRIYLLGKITTPNPALTFQKLTLLESSQKKNDSAPPPGTFHKLAKRPIWKCLPFCNMLLI